MAKKKTKVSKANKSSDGLSKRELAKLAHPALKVEIGGVSGKAKGKKGKPEDGQVAVATGTTNAPIGSAQEEAPPPIEGPGRLMVIMAHPDDAEFTCGGTVAKFCAEGWEAHYVLVTGGDKGTHDPLQYPEKLAAIREEEQRAACRRLGVKDVHFLGYPDGFTVDEHELRGQIVRLLRLHRPDVVITWDAWRTGFNHRDHRNVGTVVSDAVYPLVRDRLFYQRDEEDGLESHQVNEILLAGADRPDYVVDITDHWMTKVDAILCHESQVGGRTKEDFLKQREEDVAKNGDKPIEERFRRWSIRRPNRKPAAEAEAEAEAEAAKAKTPAHDELALAVDAPVEETAPIRDGTDTSVDAASGEQTPAHDHIATTIDEPDSPVAAD